MQFIPECQAMFTFYPLLVKLGIRTLELCLMLKIPLYLNWGVAIRPVEKDRGIARGGSS